MSCAQMYEKSDAIAERMSSELQISAKEGQKVLIIAIQTNDFVKQLLTDAQNQVGASGNVQQESPSTLCKILHKTLCLFQRLLEWFLSHKTEIYLWVMEYMCIMFVVFAA